MASFFEEAMRTVDFLANRKKAYQQAFKTPAGSQVLQDLAKFCRAHDSTFSPDPRVHALYEGRKEVWLRIERHLNLAPNELFEIYTNGRTVPTETGATNV